jgi:citrate lyase subunit beta/citryl-CoA lyase/(S)-citramalyl-CoA lyase
MNVSYLYTPAARIDSLIANRRQIEADAIVLDLEDSTHTHAKAQARAKVAAADLSVIVELGIEIGIRINTIRSFDGLRDLDMLKTVFERGTTAISAVFVPKVNHHSEVSIYRDLFRRLPFQPKIVSFIETIDAVEDADAIAGTSDAVCFGQADLVSAMYSPNAAYVDYARARLCVAAAKHKILAIDTNSFEIENMKIFEDECMAAKSYGFTGKAAIHPRQVTGINKVFAVSPEMVARYRTTISAYENAAVGFQLMNGEVIAPPFVAKARLMLDLYDQGRPQHSNGRNGYDGHNRAG